MSLDYPHPARLTPEQVAKRLGFAVHDVPVLIAEGLLKPLGKPVASATKYFASVEIEAFALDTRWLNKATQALYDFWKQKNARKTANARVVPQSFSRSGMAQTNLPVTSHAE
jgi:hypothetical protein